MQTGDQQISRNPPSLHCLTRTVEASSFVDWTLPGFQFLQCETASVGLSIVGLHPVKRSNKSTLIYMFILSVMFLWRTLTNTVDVSSISTTSLWRQASFKLYLPFPWWLSLFIFTILWSVERENSRCVDWVHKNWVEYISYIDWREEMRWFCCARMRPRTSQNHMWAQ